MKLCVYLASVIALSIYVLVANGNEITTTPDWRPIYGYVSEIATAYIDDNHIVKIQSENHNYVRGAVLISLNEEMPVAADDKTYKFKSIIRHIVVNCKSGAYAPVANFYFSVSKPTEKDIPVLAVKYEQKDENVGNLRKESPIRMAFCPIYT